MLLHHPLMSLRKDFAIDGSECGAMRLDATLFGGWIAEQFTADKAANAQMVGVG